MEPLPHTASAIPRLSSSHTQASASPSEAVRRLVGRSDRAVFDLRRDAVSFLQSGQHEVQRCRGRNLRCVLPTQQGHDPDWVFYGAPQTDRVCAGRMRGLSPRGSIVDFSELSRSPMFGFDVAPSPHDENLTLAPVMNPSGDVLNSLRRGELRRMNRSRQMGLDMTKRDPLEASARSRYSSPGCYVGKK